MAASILNNLLFGALLFAAAQPSVTLPQVLAHLQADRAAADFKAAGRLVHVIGQQRKTYQVSLRARTFSGVLKLFCEITDPAPSRVRLLLESYPDGHIVIRTGHPGDRAPTDLPSDRWGEGLLDTDFSIEDLMENQFLWKNQTLLEETRFGARQSVVLKSLPGASNRTIYSAVTTFLDKQILYPLKEEKVLKGTGVTKEYVFFGLRESQGVWSASQIECRTQGKPGSTLLIISRGSEKAHLDETAFAPALLIKP